MDKEKFKTGTTIRVTRDRLEDLKRLSKEKRWPLQEIVDEWLSVLIKNADRLFPKIESQLKHQHKDNGK